MSKLKGHIFLFNDSPFLFIVKNQKESTDFGLFSVFFTDSSSKLTM